MPNLKRIAVVGKKGVGKTTMLGARLVDRGYQRESFAGPLKEDAVAMLNYFLFVIYDFSEADYPMITMDSLDANKELYVPFLQWLGTNFVREGLSRDQHWIDMLTDELTLTFKSAPDQGIVVDDVRFENEVQALRDLDFTIIRLMRNEDDRLAYLRQRIVKAKGWEKDSIHDMWKHEEELEADLQTILSHASETKLEAVEADAVLLPRDADDFDEIVHQIGTGTLLQPSVPLLTWKLKPKPIKLNPESVTTGRIDVSPPPGWVRVRSEQEAW